MFLESKTRSIIKAISWRIIAELVTVSLVYIFFRRFDLALALGGLEIVIKMIVYFIHERIWDRVKFGRKEIPAFVVWITGIPLSGKTTIGNALYEKLQKEGIKVQRLDSKDVRALFPEVGYTKEERNEHIKRVGYLASILERNGVSSVASFISPYKESRDFVRKNIKNFVEIYTKASAEICMKRDKQGIYEKALKGEIKNFTGISDVYEEPQNPEIIINTEE
jgi:adenylylsulfate kinase